ncbi:MAG: tetratricopeptide repeat protein [Nitrospirae bacterium]|nr:tetratricopeptide repeat protein [Nitrospirota bacterium]
MRAAIIDRETYRQPKAQFLITFILITLLTFIIYSNSFSSSFHFDDRAIIIENKGIQSLSNLLKFPFSGNRYIGVFSFAINYYFGGLNVLGYHLVNTFIHILNGILVWWFVILTFRTPMMKRSAIGREQIFFIALISSLIFVAHPVQTQAVTYIVQRLASLATLFYLLSLCLFIKWRLSSTTKSNLIFYLLAIISSILAMKTKEISFTLPFVILLYEFFFFRDRLLKRAYFLVPFLLTLLIIPMTIVNVSKPLGKTMAGELSRASHLAAENVSRTDYILTQFRVIVTYIRLLFFPVNQMLDYDYPIFHSFLIPEVILSFLFLVVIICFGVYLLVRFLKGGNGYALLVSFGIFWFFITLSVESSIIPISDVIFEHRLYLPSVGAVTAFGSTVMYAVEEINKRIQRGNSLIISCIAILCVVLPLSITTYQRNMVWKNDITLWEDVVRKSPYNARGYNNLGSAYDKAGRTIEAVREFKIALRLAPDYWDAHYNLGIIYSRQGHIDEAIEEYKTALKYNPIYADGHNILGIIYANNGRMDEAIEEFKTTLKLVPDHKYASSNLNLANQKKISKRGK